MITATPVSLTAVLHFVAAGRNRDLDRDVRPTVSPNWQLMRRREIANELHLRVVKSKGETCFRDRFF